MNSVVRSGKAPGAVVAARVLLDTVYRGVAGRRPVSTMCGLKLGDAAGVFSPGCVHRKSVDQRSESAPIAPAGCVGAPNSTREWPDLRSMSEESTNGPDGRCTDICICDHLDVIFASIVLKSSHAHLLVNADVLRLSFMSHMATVTAWLDRRTYGSSVTPMWP